MKLDNKLDNKHFPATKHSKAYWLPRVFRPVIRGKEVDNYAVRMSYGNVQRSLSTGTPNRDEAAQIARDWFIYLSANGWSAFLAKYGKKKEGLANAGPTPKESGVTVGDYLAAVRAESELPVKTFTDYAGCLRLIVSEIRAMGKSKLQ